MSTIIKIQNYILNLKELNQDLLASDVQAGQLFSDGKDEEAIELLQSQIERHGIEVEACELNINERLKQLSHWTISDVVLTSIKGTFDTLNSTKKEMTALLEIMNCIKNLTLFSKVMSENKLGLKVMKHDERLDKLRTYLIAFQNKHIEANAYIQQAKTVLRPEIIIATQPKLSEAYEEFIQTRSEFKVMYAAINRDRLFSGKEARVRRRDSEQADDDERNPKRLKLDFSHFRLAI
jgi:hypothetical protein